jgi:hypothetical protein
MVTRDGLGANPLRRLQQLNENSPILESNSIRWVKNRGSKNLRKLRSLLYWQDKQFWGDLYIGLAVFVFLENPI